MEGSKQTGNRQNIFLRISPVHRILISSIAALITFFIIRNREFGYELIATVLWDVFAFFNILISWVVIFTRSQNEIVKVANKDDGSKPFVLTSILLTSVASLFAVLLLMLSEDLAKGNDLLILLAGVLGMVLSWFMVHTLFTFHYAHMFYGGSDENIKGGMEFPGKDKPGYLDFAYFSFVIGMTFQVSDVKITSAKVRRTVLAHSLLAFALNTFEVALTINLVAGLNK